jgi:hypothetical protein
MELILRVVQKEELSSTPLSLPLTLSYTHTHTHTHTITQRLVQKCEDSLLLMICIRIWPMSPTNMKNAATIFGSAEILALDWDHKTGKLVTLFSLSFHILLTTCLQSLSVSLLSSFFCHVLALQCHS